MNNQNMNNQNTKIKLLLFGLLFGFLIIVPFDVVHAVCGDGLLEYRAPDFEECENHPVTGWSPGCYDNNYANPSLRCKAKPGWACNGGCTDTCGDGITQATSDEQCDNGAYNDTTFCNYTPTNPGNCNYCLNHCATSVGGGTPQYCGDNTLQSNYEACDDGENLNTGYCNADCSAITSCGDGTVQSPNGFGKFEACDPNGTSDTVSCDYSLGYDSQACTPRVCGDGYRNIGSSGSPTFISPEACDDGNTTNQGPCNASCSALTYCGDGIVQAPNGSGISEQCDDGNATNQGTCNATCTALTYCGDNIVQTPNGAGINEACDDGNTTNQGSCNGTCTALTYCGDSVTQSPNGFGVTEQCDDGNSINGDGCNADCTSASCGNGFVEAGEQCDGNGTGIGGETAGCDSNCTTRICGDSTINTTSGEQCDPPGGSCNGSCLLTACGNNFVDSGEQCDEWTSTTHSDSATCNANCSNRACNDGYLNSFEVCDPSAPNPFNGATCASQTGGARPSGTLSCSSCSSVNTNNCYNCGNGIIEGPEACDDRNNVNGDGCNNICQIETGWECNNNPSFDGDGTPAQSSCGTLCGNGSVNPGEACDDGNTTNETATDCPYGASCSFCNSTCSATLNFTGPACGDGNTDVGEVCDLGSVRNNDPNCPYGQTACTACVNNCSTQQPGNPRYCGDHIFDASNEECDYDTGAIATSGDGCSNTCEIEDGYSCGNFGPGGSYICVFHCGGDVNGDGNNHDVNVDVNGDGIADINEECDAGANNGLRCTPTTYGTNCNWCTNACQTRTVTGDYCGDGEINSPQESCDQGNTVSGDGCNVACQVESGWSCTGARNSRCTPISGDGVCVGTPYETCTNNFQDCGPCSVGNILTALPGQNQILNSILRNIENILPPQLRINIPGLIFNRATVNQPIEVEVQFLATDPLGIKKSFFVGAEENFITINEINTDGTINITFE